MNAFERQAREIVEKHGCKFIRMVRQCGVVWESKFGYRFITDIFVLEMMSEDNWNYWGNKK